MDILFHNPPVSLLKVKVRQYHFRELGWVVVLFLGGLGGINFLHIKANHKVSRTREKEGPYSVGLWASANRSGLRHSIGHWIFCGRERGKPVRVTFANV